MALYIIGGFYAKLCVLYLTGKFYARNVGIVSPSDYNNVLLYTKGRFYAN